MAIVKLLDISQIQLIIKELASILSSKNIIVLLQGDLASGKTTLVKEYIKYLKLNDVVTSPTFSLQTIYDDKIYHYDLYNKTLEQFIALGLLEEFEKDGIHFVEWGEDNLKTVLDEYGFELIVIKINKKENKREYIIES